MSIELKQLADWHASQACQVRKAAECGTAAENKEPVHGCLLRLADWHDRQSHILRTAIQQAESEPVAWRYELAMRLRDGVYEDWRGFIAPNRPNVPAASIRNLEPLYTHPAPGVPDDVVRDAGRWRWVAGHVAASNARGPESWAFHYEMLPKPLDNPLKGSTSQHFANAIDAAMLSAK